MAMTSKQIEDALKPFINFAPAIHACADIVAAKEEAEAAMKPLLKEKGDLEKQIVEIESRLGDIQGKVNKEKASFASFMADQEAKRAEAKAQTQKTADDLSAMQLKLLNLKAEFEDKRKEKEAEVAAVEVTRDKIKAEIERLKKQFAA